MFSRVHIVQFSDALSENSSCETISDFPESQVWTWQAGMVWCANMAVCAQLNHKLVLLVI